LALLYYGQRANRLRLCYETLLSDFSSTGHSPRAFTILHHRRTLGLGRFVLHNWLMAKVALLFLALLTNACSTTSTRQRETSASLPPAIIWIADDEFLRGAIEDRRNWIDSNERP
jgi:hypothetical protein